MELSIKLTFGLICIACVLSSSNSARILGLFPTHSRSHLIIHSAIAEALAERGHNVTVVSTHKPLKKNLPYRYIYLEVPPISAEIFSEAVNKQPSFFRVITNFISALSEISNSSLHHPQMQKLMDEESFDLVLHGYFLNDFMFGVAAHFKCPIILSFTIRAFPNVNDFVGNPQEFAYVPTLATSVKQSNGFLDRVSNFVHNVVLRELAYRPYLWWTQEMYYRANFPSDRYPSLDTMMKNVSLVFTASHFSQGPIRPNVPALVEIGGIHIKEKPDPLPEDIKSILDNSTQNGAIYFSLGTNIYKSHLDETKLKAIFKALSKLPHTVLCKWSDPELPLESPNIIYKNWLPQDDVLNHPNVKLFVTHGGLGGIAEAQFHGVPMVGIPLLNDQHMNMENVKNAGFGLSLDYATLSEKIVNDAIEEVLTNQTYRNNVRQFARLYRDRPMTAKQTAVYWVEYVLRHRGAPHMQSPAVHLNHFQLLSLDVIGFLLAIVFVIFKVTKMAYLLLKRLLCRNKVKKE
ncbi:UDP-glycosyltransferase UGT5-like [Eupeodes corollae]|uniref:UDP-glycosyltransferase UGT5-like n=1 Tax=Eupeodes corollae TaxID=290404 RepID=UPI00248F5CA5|nr:UDP-glycosyltransferase UGT5-like [Eupeodes corollae]